MSNDQPNSVTPNVASFVARDMCEWNKLYLSSDKACYLFFGFDYMVKIQFLNDMIRVLILGRAVTKLLDGQMCMIVEICP